MWMRRKIAAVRAGGPKVSSLGLFLLCSLFHVPGGLLGTVEPLGDFPGRLMSQDDFGGAVGQVLPLDQVVLSIKFSRR